MAFTISFMLYVLENICVSTHIFVPLKTFLPIMYLDKCGVCKITHTYCNFFFNPHAAGG